MSNPIQPVKSTTRAALFNQPNFNRNEDYIVNNDNKSTGGGKSNANSVGGNMANNLPFGNDLSKAVELVE